MFKILILVSLLVGLHSQRPARQPTYLFGGRNCGEVAEVDIFARVTGGRNVTEGEMPWMIRLDVTYVNTQTESCGGFIVDQNWVATAAHCLKEVAVVKVSAGRLSYEWGSNARNEQVMVVPVTRLHIHPDYQEATYTNDIGLLHLPRPLQFNQHVRPICLLDEESCGAEPTAASSYVDFCDTNVTSAGWGKNASGIPSEYLKAVQLSIVPRSRCLQSYRTSKHIYPQHICAHGQQLGEDTCQGDSGGPLICFQNRKAVAIGIVSFGPKECGSQLPGVYQRVCSHIGWMKSMVSNIVFSTTPAPSGCEVPNRRSGNKVIDISNGNQYDGGEMLPLGALVRMSCVSGFREVFPDRQSTCTTGGVWVPAVGHCQKVEEPAPTPAGSGNCDEPTVSVNARVLPGETYVGAERIVQCQFGFEKDGSAKYRIFCRRSLEWSDSAKCERAVTPVPRIIPTTIPLCPQPPTFTNAVVGDGPLYIGATRLITCNDGYAIPNFNAPVITCQANRQWSYPGTCERLCPTIIPNGVANGIISDGTHTMGSNRSVVCRQGYSLVGSTTITCLRTGHWSQPGTCEVAVCQNSLPNIVHGIVSQGGMSVGSVRQISCQYGYKLKGPSSIQCSVSGDWSAPGFCEAIPCEALPRIRNAMVSSGNLTVGSVRHVVCQAGYYLVGSNTINCTGSGEWSAPPTCEFIRCPSVPRVGNGMVSSGFMSAGSVRQIICQAGYRIQGPNTITCLKSGVWSQPGVCRLSYCGNVPRISNAMISAGSKMVDSVRQITCQAGYKKQGPSTITCLNTLEWSTPPTCEKCLFNFLFKFEFDFDLFSIKKKTVFCPVIDLQIANAYRIKMSRRNDVGTTIRIRCKRGFLIKGPDEIVCQLNETWSQPGQCRPPSVLYDYQCFSSLNKTTARLFSNFKIFHPCANQII